MKWPAFAYAKARTLDEAFTLRRDAGPDSKWIAGGQSLLVSLAFRLQAPSALIDISQIEALGRLRETGDGGLSIGAATTHATLGASEIVRARAPLLAQAAPLIAHAAIRNRGTVGGNIAYADPASELPACLVALDARIFVASPRGERRIAAEDFFVGLFETALEEDEIIIAVETPAPPAASAIREISRRPGDYAMAGLAATFGREGGRVTAARLVYFGVGPGPVHATQASATLVAGGVAAAQDALDRDLRPQGDHQASADMMLHLSRVLLRRVVDAGLGERSAAA